MGRAQLAADGSPHNHARSHGDPSAAPCARAAEKVRTAQKKQITLEFKTAFFDTFSTLVDCARFWSPTLREVYVNSSLF